jgi:nucleotide-binding universal stress UspA family protein
VFEGRPATVVVEEADRTPADLVVVGSRGHGRLASLVLGSVSAEIVDRARQPVLVARSASLTRVVLAADGSPSAAHAERLVATWPLFASTPVRVVSVAEVVEPWRTGIAPTMYTQAIAAYQHDLEEARQHHERLAAEAAERLRAAGREAGSEGRTGDPPAEIVAAAEGFGADLVAMGSRGNTGVKRLVLGSVARDVVYGGTTSVLIARDDGEEG